MLSPHESAAILADVLGRPVAYVQIPPPALREALLQAGLPPIMADGYEEMMGNMAKHLAAGDFSDEPQSAESAGTTTFRNFATQALKPALESKFAATA